MGLFQSKEEKAEKAAESLKREAIFKEKQRIKEEEAIEKQRIKKEEEAAAKVEKADADAEKQRIEIKLDAKIKEFGMHKLMADPKVYNEIIIAQNERIISMLGQVAILASSNFASSGIVIAEKKAHNDNIKKVLKRII